MKLDVPALCDRARQRFIAGDYDGAWTFVQAARAHMGAEPQPELLRLLGNLAAEFNDLTSGVALLNQSLDAFRLVDDHDGEIIAATNLAALLQRTGNLVYARALVERALAQVRAEAAGQHSRLLNVAANIAILQGRAHDALPMVYQAREHAEGRAVGWVELTLASALEHLGHYQEAQTVLEQAAPLIASDDLVTKALFHAARAWLYVLEQSHAFAADACDRALAMVHPERHQWLYWPIISIRGVILRESGQIGMAEKVFQEAARALCDSGDLLARISLDWQRVALCYAKKDEACAADHLVSVLQRMQAGGFVTTLLWQPAMVVELCTWARKYGLEETYAELLLDSLRNQSQQANNVVAAISCRDAGLDELTLREQEVLQFVGQGLRDRDIAQTLCLSIRTVQNHLQSCYTKLGVHSRMEAMLHMRPVGIRREMGRIRDT